MRLSGAEPLRRLLAGSWRERPPPVAMDAADIGRAAGLALTKDAAALAWWALRGSPAEQTPEAALLRAAYLRSHLQAAVNERLLGDVLRALATRRIRAVVVKGWAMARLYPSPGLRAYHDIDLLVDRADLAAARRVRDEVVPASAADLQADGDLRLLRGWDELVGRARPVPLHDVEALVLGPEDDLRLACLHGLRHGFVRPVWLCDVALLMERLPEGADWEYLLAGPAPAASWLRHTLGLAASMLDASTGRMPGEAKLPAAPRWMRTAVLEAWSRPRVPTALLQVLRSRPWAIVTELRSRWACPLATAHRHRVTLGARPPTALQAMDYLERSRSYVGRLLPGAARPAAS